MLITQKSGTKIVRTLYVPITLKQIKKFQDGALVTNAFPGLSSHPDLIVTCMALAQKGVS